MKGLVACETDGHTLLKAAEFRKDEKLLLQLRGQDLVSIEVKYHKSCYQSYVRCVTYSYQKKTEEESGIMYAPSFKKFCDEVVQRRLIDNDEVVPINVLKNIFIKMINDIEDIDASSYKNMYLKKRLKQRFGDKIKFLRPHMQKCELVMAHKESDSGGRILNITHTDSESEEDEAESQSFAAHSNSQQHEMLEMIHSAMNIHATLEKAQGVAAWPPRAEDLTIQRSRDIVPTKLFNFLAWCTGLSQDFHSQDRVDVQADVENKLLSICQDMMFLSSQGRKLTPKHLSLGMAVRHVTGSSSLIGLLNGLGHCVSHSKVLEHDTALAIQQLHGDGLPPGFCQEVFTTLVWDNNDFGEETLSGKGTTHNTNGIVIQRNLGDDTDDNDSNPSISVAVTKSKQRTLQVPPTNIIEYHGRPRHGPALSGFNVDEIFQNQGREQKIPLKKDLAFWLCKTVQVEGEECNLLPSWTGFNQKLSGSVTPPVSKIGYLPVIDASPTDKSTVNTILSRSVDIANKLSLQSIVVTMDQAIYSKAQEIRWQNEEYTQRLFYVLESFTQLCHFCLQ
ncbi:uncharacterized protein [Ptychodera flava]|uniref:uncharacterized protein n=1 Tax=Ptychodera flava TaxID=63121 RepID=UPI00396A62FC